MNNTINKLTFEKTDKLTNTTIPSEPELNNKNFQLQDDDLKYKVRIYGVNKPIQSSNKIERNAFDNEEINKITTHCGLSKLPIRDFFRMGRYDTKSTRPLPILVHFQSVWDVRKLLSLIHI